jgi:alpha/beta superfamily hydrolase
MPEVIFNGPEGRIEGRYHESEESSSAPAALVLHPHPLHGGTMNNKVVYNIYQSFVRNNFSVLRINFRGVGKSQGKFDNGVGELMDAATAMDWLQLQRPNASSFWIAGFSFGSWIALQLLMRRPEIREFIAVSPPVNMNSYDFGFLSPCPTPGLIVQGDMDSIVAESAVSNFVDKISKQRSHPVTYKVINDADHFYREKIEDLSFTLDEYITNRCKIGTIMKKNKPDRRRRSVSEEN